MKRLSLRFSILVVLFGLAAGAASNWIRDSADPATSSFMFGLVGTYLAFVWFRMDSDNRSYRRSPFLSICMVGITGLAIPYYLLRSRGSKKGLLAVLLFAMLFVVYFVAVATGQQIARALRT